MKVAEIIDNISKAGPEFFSNEDLLDYFSEE